MTTQPESTDADVKLKQALKRGVRDLIRSFEAGKVPAQNAGTSGPTQEPNPTVSKAVLDLAIVKAVPQAVHEATGALARKPTVAPTKEPPKQPATEPPKENYAARRRRELEAEKQRKLAEEQARQQKEAAEKARPKENWRETQARMERETQELAELAAQREEEMAALLDKLVPVVEPPDGENVFFRGSGKGQEPWDLLATGGFIHRSGEPSPQTIISTIRALFDPNGTGPNDIMAVYRGSNSNTIGAPFISAGRLKEDNQGGTGPIWQFAIELPAVRKVTVTAAALGLPALHPDVGDVRIMTDTGQLAGASTVLILHGPLPEATWLTKIPASSLKAFYGLAGKPWKRKWRAFEAGQIKTFKEILEKYGVQM